MVRGQFWIAGLMIFQTILYYFVIVPTVFSFLFVSVFTVMIAILGPEHRHSTAVAVAFAVGYLVYKTIRGSYGYTRRTLRNAPVAQVARRERDPQVEG
jgi:hypothetical protein